MEIVYPLGSVLGDLAYRDAQRAKREAEIRERILYGERGLDYDEDAERRARTYEARSRRRARTQGVNIIGRIDRQAIIARDNSTCHLCNKPVPADDIHLDHVIPLALGGEHSAANLRVAHSTCNLSKGARLIT